MHFITQQPSEPWLLFVIYTKQAYKDKNRMWKFLVGIDLTDIPWLLHGDLNSIVNDVDKLGGSLFVLKSLILSLQNFISYTSLTNLRFLWLLLHLM